MPRSSRTPKVNSMLNDDSELFQGSVAAMSAAEGYLGSVRVVEGLLRVMVSDWTDALGSGTATADLAKKLATEYSEILIGDRDGFGKVPGWTKPGGIDVFVASELGLPERGRDAIENALVKMLTQTTEIVNYADEPGVLPEHWQWQVDAMFEEYVNLFLGVPGEPADEPSEPLTEGWVTINTGDDDEGGQRVYIDGSGKMQTGAFKGKTFDQAFGKGKVKAKRDADQSAPPPAESPKPTAPDPKPAEKSAPNSKPHIAAKDEKELTDQMQKFIKAGFRISNDGQGTYHIHDPNTNEVKGTLAIGKGTAPTAPDPKPADAPAPAAKAPAIDLSLPKSANAIRSVKVGDSTMVIDANANTGKVQLSSLRTPASKRGKGSAGKAMNELTGQADKTGTTLHLTASPLDGKTNRDKLVAFYQKHGFELTGKKGNPAGDPEMVRKPKPADSPAGDGAPKLAKPAAFGSMMGGPAKSVNTSLNEMPHTIDAGGVGLMFDIVGANEHDELAKAIKTVRPDMASAVDAEVADRKASAEKWAKAKAEHDDLMSVHPSLAKPSDLNKTKVKAAFKDVAPDQHDKLIKAISAARPDLADHAAASKPKAKAAKVDPMHAPSPNSKDKNFSLAHSAANKAYDAWSSEHADLVDDFASSDKSEPAALNAFVSSEFTQMNADANHPASKQLKKMIDRLPDYQPPSGKIHRVLGFEDDAAAQAYVAKLQAGTPQEKTFSSWTHDDPTVPGANPMNNIGLDVASQFGDHAVILTYENPKGAKDISFAYFGGYEFPSSTGTEQLLQKGHKFKVTGVEKKGLKTYVKLSNP